MNVFEEGHMTPAAQKMDEIMAAEGRYWDAQCFEYRHADQDIPGKAFVVHFLPPGEVMIEPVSQAHIQSSMDQSLEVA